MLALMEGSRYATQNLRVFVTHSTGMRLASGDEGCVGKRIQMVVI